MSRKPVAPEYSIAELDREVGEAIRAFCTDLGLPAHCTTACRRANRCVTRVDALGGGSIPPGAAMRMTSGLLPPCAALNWEAFQPLLLRALEETGSLLTTSFPVPFLYNACAYFTFTIAFDFYQFKLERVCCGMCCVACN